MQDAPLLAQGAAGVGAAGRGAAAPVLLGMLLLLVAGALAALARRRRTHRHRGVGATGRYAACAVRIVDADVLELHEEVAVKATLLGGVGPRLALAAGEAQAHVPPHHTYGSFPTRAAAAAAAADDTPSAVTPP